jgi:hypothetical protein
MSFHGTADLPRSRVHRITLCAMLGALACHSVSAEVGEFSIPAITPLSHDQTVRLQRLARENSEARHLAEAARDAALPLLDAVPHPLATIHYEGLVNTDPRRVATVAQLREMAEVALLARHWQVSADERAAATLRRFVAEWSAAYRPTGNDVNENKLYPLLVAYHGLRGSFAETERTRIDAWVETLGSLHHRAVEESTRFTNRYSKHVRLLALCGRIVDRAAWAAAAEAGVRRFVEHSLHADGTSTDLLARDTLTYHASALVPILELAMLTGPEGGSLRKSVDYVVPYALGEKTRQEWVHSKVALDRRRAEAGIGKYQPGIPYAPISALELMEQASCFDPSLLRVVRHLTGSAAERFPTWQTLVGGAAAGEVAE